MQCAAFAVLCATVICRAFALPCFAPPGIAWRRLCLAAQPRPASLSTVFRFIRAYFLPFQTSNSNCRLAQFLSLRRIMIHLGKLPRAMTGGQIFGHDSFETCKPPILHQSKIFWIFHLFITYKRWPGLPATSRREQASELHPFIIIFPSHRRYPQVPACRGTQVIEEIRLPTWGPEQLIRNLLAIYGPIW